MLSARLAAGGLLAALLVARPASAEPASWVMTSIVPEGSPTAVALEKVARGVDAASGGRVKVRLRLGGVVADEDRTLEMCAQGRIQAWGGSTGAVAAKIPALAVFETPYLFEDVAAFDRAVRGDVLTTPRLGKAFREAGLVPYGIAFTGWRAMGSREKPIRVPADVAGMRVRSQPVPLHRAMWRLLGADARDVPLTEVQAQFQQKRLEAVDLPALYVYATSLAGQVKYFTRTNHMMQTGMVVLCRGAFDRIPKKTQAAILARGPEMGIMTSRAHEPFEAELVDLLSKQDIRVIDPNPEERAAWKSFLTPLRAEALKIAGAAGAELLKALEAGVRRGS